MESTHPFSVSFAPCFQAVLCRSQLSFRMFLEKLFQICADRFIMKQKRRCFSPFLLSPSSRRAWIEIFRCRTGCRRRGSPSSRRAWIEIATSRKRHPKSSVALLAEGVDRNTMRSRRANLSTLSPSSRRAWIEIQNRRRCQVRPRSPSSRRAWIEINSAEKNQKKNKVALLAEGVDRNARATVASSTGILSPSSRRAWIEISGFGALAASCCGRPPRGGRG